MFKRIKSQVRAFTPRKANAETTLQINKDKKNLNKKLLLVLFPAIIFFLVLSGFIIFLVINKPDLTLSQIELHSQEIKIENINQSSKYPLIIFNTPKRVIFSNGMTLNKVTEIQLQAEYFSEGENEITIQDEKDYKLFKLLSKDRQYIEVNVDRIAPKFEITESPKNKYLLLEPFNLTYQVEKGAVLYNNDASFFKVTAEQGSLSIPVLDGNNTINLYAQDEFGNKSKVNEFSFIAFQKAEYSKKECQGITFPIAPELRFGLSGYNPNVPNVPNVYFFEKPQSLINDFNSESDYCDDLTMSYRIFLTDDSFINCNPCGGAGIISDYIEIKTINKSASEYINEIKNSTNIISDEDIITMPGYPMKYLKTKSFSELDNESTYRRYYIFEHKSKTYEISMFNFGTEYNALSPYMNEIANNLKLSE